MKGKRMASEQLTIMVNGKETPATAGALLLHVLRDAGVSFMAYSEHFTFLLFLKMAD